MCIDGRPPFLGTTMARICRGSRKANTQFGLSLIELVIFIVIVSVGVVGILAVMNVATQHSADPMVRKQAAAMAEAILDEILSKNYCDPDLIPPTCTVSREASRTLYDDVQDYDGQTILGTDTLGSTSILALAGYSATIAVSDVTISSANMKKVAVTVTGGGEAIVLYGYRASY